MYGEIDAKKTVTCLLRKFFFLQGQSEGVLLLIAYLQFAKRYRQIFDSFIIKDLPMAFSI